MAELLSRREQRRRVSETAILDAAWGSFARSGPDGVPLREVAAAAGCTHALVARYFGSKDGLVRAVGDRLAARTAATLDEVWDSDVDPLAAMLSVARDHPACAQLLVRSALGDLRPDAFPSAFASTVCALPSPPPARAVADRGGVGAPASSHTRRAACCSGG